MVALLNSLSYLAIVKWKAGERRALASLWASRRNDLTPLFEIPPSGDFDHEKQRPLTPLEHIRLFGKRLHEAWGRSLSFIDAMAVDDDTHKAGLLVHPLTELLERAQAARAIACPATSLKHSPDYQDAVRRFATHYTNLPIAIRVNPLDDMESETFAEDFANLLEYLGCTANRVVLVLDFASLGALKPREVESFVETVTERIYYAIELGPWLKVVTAFTSFPTLLKMKPNQVATFSRTDWEAYKLLMEREPALRQKIAYGDYGIDSSPFSKPSGPVAPSAQLRLSGKEDYLVVKGVQAKKPIGYAAIRPVAEIVVGRDEFVGPAFCEGDAFINRVRNENTATGNASTWRWACTDHHFARVLADLATLAGRKPVLAAAPEPLQEELFELLNHPSSAPR